MKKPSPALEAGPLPGLSQTNYNVLIGVTALGVAAPALLAATAVLPSMLPAKAPPTKGKPQTQAAKAPVGAAKFKFAEALPTLSQAGRRRRAAPKKAPAPKAKPARRRPRRSRPRPRRRRPRAPAPAPEPAGRRRAKDAQVALFGKEAPALVNTAAGATSGDDVSAALKAARLKATTKAGAVKPKAAAAAAAAPAAPSVQMSALDPRNLDTAITNLRDPGTENLDQAIEKRARSRPASGKSRNLDEAARTRARSRSAPCDDYSRRSESRPRRGGPAPFRFPRFLGGRRSWKGLLPPQFNIPVCGGTNPFIERDRAARSMRATENRSRYGRSS